jgi:CheY-like chemotaxis protein
MYDIVVIEKTLVKNLDERSQQHFIYLKNLRDRLTIMVDIQQDEYDFEFDFGTNFVVIPYPLPSQEQFKNELLKSNNDSAWIKKICNAKQENIDNNCTVFRLLLVTSSVGSGKISSKQLSKCFEDLNINFSIQVAKNGIDALRYCDDMHHIDLIILDNALTEYMGKSELLEFFRNQQKTENSYVILLSTNSLSVTSDVLSLGIYYSL